MKPIPTRDNATRTLALLALLSTGMCGCKAGAQPDPALAGKISPAASAAAAALENHAETRDRRIRTDQDGRLEIYVYVDSLNPSTLASLAQAGLVNTQSSPAMSVVQGWIAPQDLARLAALACVRRVDLPQFAVPR